MGGRHSDPSPRVADALGSESHSMVGGCWAHQHTAHPLELGTSHERCARLARPRGRHTTALHTTLPCHRRRCVCCAHRDDSPQLCPGNSSHRTPRSPRGAESLDPGLVRIEHRVWPARQPDALSRSFSCPRPEHAQQCFATSSRARAATRRGPRGAAVLSGHLGGFSVHDLESGAVGGAPFREWGTAPAGTRPTGGSEAARAPSRGVSPWTPPDIGAAETAPAAPGG